MSDLSILSVYCKSDHFIRSIKHQNSIFSKKKSLVMSKIWSILEAIFPSFLLKDFSFVLTPNGPIFENNKVVMFS